MVVSRLDYEKETDNKWAVYYIGQENQDPNFLHTRRKRIASIVRDVDGEWLLFFDEYRGGGFALHTMGDLLAIFCRFRNENG